MTSKRTTAAFFCFEKGQINNKEFYSAVCHRRIGETPNLCNDDWKICNAYNNTK